MEMRIPLKSFLLVSALALTPVSANADIIELSQGQLRQLVQQEQVLGSETISTTATSAFGGEVVDIRGFLSEGRMTYRVLLQRDDGSVIELLYDGPNGQRVSHNSDMGQVVSSEARSNNGLVNANAGNSGNNGNGNGNSGNNGNGNSGNNGNGNSGNNGNGNGNGNSGNNGNGNGNSGNNGK